MSTININTERINHLLKLYQLEIEDFLSLLSKGLKNRIKKEDIFTEDIKVSLLKRVDKVFDKGLNYYLDPKPLRESKEESIFFRKDKFKSLLFLSIR